MSKTVPFQKIQFSRSTWFKCNCSLIIKFSLVKVLIQTIQFHISTLLVSVQPIDRALSGATIPGQNEPGSNGNEGMLRIPQSSSITETKLSDCLVSYRGLSGVGSYPSAEAQSVYSTAPANWANKPAKGYFNAMSFRNHVYCTFISTFSYKRYITGIFCTVTWY